MIIDFDQSKKDDYVTPEDSIDDLRRISRYMLSALDQTGQQQARNKLLGIIATVYGDMINIDSLRAQLT